MSPGEPRVLRIALVVSTAIAITCAAPCARGQTADTNGPAPQMSNEMRAEYLFRTGEKKFDAGKYAEACADFSQSLRLGPKLGTLLNLALCHETIGKPATAWTEWNHAAAWAAQNGQKERHDYALQHAVALETKLPRVLLQIPSSQAIATVEVDGEPLPDSRWYLPVYLDPGEHTVALTAPGKQRGTVQFRVINSPTAQLVAVPPLVDEPPRPVTPAVPPSDPDRTKRIAGIVTLAGGGAALVLGLTFGASAMASRNEAADRCIGNRCTPEGADAWDSAQGKATVATVSSLVGLAALGVGTWLVFSSRPATPGSPATTALAAGARGRSEGGLDLAIGGAF